MKNQKAVFPAERKKTDRDNKCFLDWLVKMFDKFFPMPYEPLNYLYQLELNSHLCGTCKSTIRGIEHQKRYLLKSTTMRIEGEVVASGVFG